jgi:cellulose synthase/poly-beta-1,6-N-acetylglucosamine synthase-like glycosyltransferase
LVFAWKFVMSWMGWGVLVVAGIVSLPCLIVAAECFLALLPLPKYRTNERRKAAVLIPAHNEQLLIGRTLQSLLPQLTEADRVLVVADNCTDNTAPIARSHGVEVLERHDMERRGKGFALAAGVVHLAANPPDVVIVFDADCVAEAGMVDVLSRTAVSTGRPVQALYLMDPPESAGPGGLISAFAFLVKNQVRARAMHRIGLPVLLTGTGMAFPWELIRDAPLATDDIVEDLTLGLTFAVAGRGPVYVESARVNGRLPDSTAGAATQRTRWEHGYLQTILTQCPRLAWTGVRGFRSDLLLVALDLVVPPLALLVLSGLVAVAVSLVEVWLNGTWWAVLMMGLAAGAAGMGLSVAWVVFARKRFPLRAMVSIPAYVLKKLPIYTGFLVHRQQAWVRTERRLEESTDAMESDTSAQEKFGERR